MTDKKISNFTWNSHIEESINTPALIYSATGQIASTVYTQSTCFKLLEFIQALSLPLEIIYSRYKIKTKKTETMTLKQLVLKVSKEIWIDIFLHDDEDDGDDDSPTFTTLSLNFLKNFLNDIKEGKKRDTSFLQQFVTGEIKIYYIKESDNIENIVKLFKQSEASELEEPELYMITQTKYGFDLKSFKIKKELIDLKTHYGEAFESVHKNLINVLNNSNKGLVLFHGAPGTGKTSYIRQLINFIPKKKLIYIPPDIVNSLTDPIFIEFLSDYPNSILIIEDAESIIKTRKGGENHTIANLLNLTDGLLGDCLAMQVIATFNCNVNEIDEALLRKGRLIGKHEFKALSKEEAQRLSDSLGFKTTIVKEMTLAEIYNQDQISFENSSKKTIGFKSS
jgi:hypothetical protein